MRVFRLLSRKEILNLYKGIDERTAVNKGVNTHTYKENEEYVHFFRYSQDAEMYKKSTSIDLLAENHYIAFMVANIPNEILEKYQSYGEYRYDNNKSDLHNCYIPICEYAIPLHEMKREYIVDIDTLIPYEYKSNKDEYEYYLSTIVYLLRKDISPMKYLKDKKITDVLDLEDDNRTEEEIQNERIEEIRRIFPNGIWD